MFRLRSFWFGLPGCLFLLWLWGMSLRWGYNFTWKNGTEGIFVRTEQRGEIELGWRSDAGWRVPQGRSLQTWKQGDGGPSVTEDAPCFPLPRNTTVKPLGSHSAMLPYWLLLAIYSAVWGGVVAWFWRRKRSQSRT